MAFKDEIALTKFIDLSTEMHTVIVLFFQVLCACDKRCMYAGHRKHSTKDTGSQSKSTTSVQLPSVVKV